MKHIKMLKNNESTTRRVPKIFYEDILKKIKKIEAERKGVEIQYISDTDAFLILRQKILSAGGIKGEIK